MVVVDAGGLISATRQMTGVVEIKSPNFEAVEVSMAQVEEKRNTVVRGVWLAWQTPTGIAFLLSKKNTLGKVFGFGLTFILVFVPRCLTGPLLISN